MPSRDPHLPFELLAKVKELNMRVRELELTKNSFTVDGVPLRGRLEIAGGGGGGGFTPISAAIYDGYYSGDPIGETSDVKYTVADAGVVGDTGEVGQAAHNPVPPSYAHNWLRYVWYDDGFSASAGKFTIPADGVYEANAHVGFSVINGHVEDCNITITGFGSRVTTFAHDDGPRDVNPGDSDVWLSCSGQAFLSAGDEVRMSWGTEMSGLTGLSGATNLIWVPRISRAGAPPADTAGWGSGTYFAITKISDTAP